MSSTLTPKWKRILYKIAPWLFVTCPEYNWHWRWDRLCQCGNDMLDLKTGIPYHHVHNACRPEEWGDWDYREKKRKELVRMIKRRYFI